MEKIADKFGYSKSDSMGHLEASISILKETLASGEEVKISGFGKFEVKQKKARRGRNPQTAEAITIGARQIVSFKPSNMVKAKINGENP